MSLDQEVDQCVEYFDHIVQTVPDYRTAIVRKGLFHSKLLMGDEEFIVAVLDKLSDSARWVACNALVSSQYDSRGKVDIFIIQKENKTQGKSGPISTSLIFCGIKQRYSTSS